MRKRAALVLPNFTLGGAERQAVELALGLPRFGWEPLVLAAESHGPLQERVLQAGFPVYHLGARFWLPKSDPRFWINLAAVMHRMRSIFVRERVVIVQSFLFWQNVITAPAAKMAPHVRGVIAGRRNLGDYKDKRRHYQYLENVANRFTDRIVCNSRVVARDTLRREKVQRGQVRVVYNGFDPGPYQRAKGVDLSQHHRELAGASKIIGTVGNLKRQKRHDLFLKMMARIREQQGGVKGLIVGRDLGEEEGLRRLARELGLEGHVAFAGGVEEPAPYYRAMHVYMLASDFEGLPNALMEAMAAGVPVVSTDVGGVPELIRDGVHGLLAKPGDVEGLASAALSLLNSPARARRLGRAASERMRRRFSTERMVRAYIHLYEELL